MIRILIWGKDRVGLMSSLTEAISAAGGNIIDIEHSVLHGLFIISMLVDIEKEKIEGQLAKKANELGLDFEVRSPEGGKKNYYIATFIGQDRPGIVHAISSVFKGLDINIESTKMIARGELIAMEMLLDIKQNPFQKVRNELIKKAEEVGISSILQSETTFKKTKRLIVFDMDSTIVDAEIVNELAKEKGVGEEVEDITKQAMEGKVNFQTALKKRLLLLKGMPLEDLEKVARNIKLVQGASELVTTLKGMGYKTCLVTGGFSYFANEIGRKLGFDYVFSNELEIVNGKLTGNLVGGIIDAEQKAMAIIELAKAEGISPEEIVAIADGANDIEMFKSVGLSIAFNAKELLKEIAHGSIKGNLKGVLYCLGNRIET